MTARPAASPASPPRLPAGAERLRDCACIGDFLRAWLARPLLGPPEQKRLDDYYRRFDGLRSPRMWHWYNEQLREANEIIAAAPGARLLEVGFGCGTEALWFAANGASVTAIDPWPRSAPVADARRRLLETVLSRRLDLRLLPVSVLELEEPEGFDIIWLEQAFHHLEPRAEVVRALVRLLRPGGWLLLSEANALNPLLQAQLFLQRGFRTVATSRNARGESYPVGDERVISAPSLSRLLAKAGIERRHVRYFRIFPSGSRYERWFRLERAVRSPWLAPVYTHYNYVGRKPAPPRR